MDDALSPLSECDEEGPTGGIVALQAVPVAKRLALRHPDFTRNQPSLQNRRTLIHSGRREVEFWSWW